MLCASIYPADAVPDDFRSALHLVKPVPLEKLDNAVRQALTSNQHCAANGSR